MNGRMNERSVQLARCGLVAAPLFLLAAWNFWTFLLGRVLYCACYVLMAAARALAFHRGQLDRTAFRVCYWIDNGRMPAHDEP